MIHGLDPQRLRRIFAAALVCALAASGPLAARTEPPPSPCAAAPEAAGPYGFGGAGWLPDDDMGRLRWTYSWNYHRDYMYDNSKFLPMVWGGPPAGAAGTWQPGKYGITSNPGCANRTGGGCTPAERQAFADLISGWAADRVIKTCGRTWLMFNEPDLPGPQVGSADSSDLDPVEAALLYDAIVSAIREVDPGARFFCCGTVVRDQSIAWLKTFLDNVSEQIDGYHMHNYFLEGAGVVDPVAALDGVIAAMIAFSNAFDDGRPITITESGNWGWPDSATAEQLEFMTGMAEWLNTEGAAYGYVGAAWFLSVSPYTAPCQRTEDDDCSFTSRTVFPLGGELIESVTGYHRAYNWRAGDSGNIEPWKGNGFWLSRVSHYRNGPCEGQTNAGCSFGPLRVSQTAGNARRDEIT